MPLRVIAGSARGRRLNAVPGDSTRPVMDRVKEACFSILGREIIDANFLDLFAGTGSVGIEALSRGARQAVFVETNGKAVKTIRDNLEVTRLEDRGIVRRVDVFAFLKSSPPLDPFDYIYIAPPQYKRLWLQALQTLDAHPGWIKSHTRVIVQIDPKEDEAVELQTVELYDQRSYGRTRLLFFAANVDA